jgi:predicted SnoaL-like aldol condensation-catalyzing enzyme
MTTMEQAIDLVRRYAEVSKTRNLDELDALFTPDFSNHSPGGAEQGLDKLKDFLSRVWDFVPDLEVTIDTIFADKVDDGEPWVGALVTLRGTRADNNQALDLQEVWTFRISEGKIAERWYVVDRAALSG